MTTAMARNSSLGNYLPPNCVVIVPSCSRSIILAKYAITGLVHVCPVKLNTEN